MSDELQGGPYHSWDEAMQAFADATKDRAAADDAVVREVLAKMRAKAEERRDAARRRKRRKRKSDRPDEPETIGAEGLAAWLDEGECPDDALAESARDSIRLFGGGDGRIVISRIPRLELRIIDEKGRGWTPSELHALVLRRMRRGAKVKHPLVALLDAWEQRARGRLSDAHLIVVRERRPPDGADAMTLAREHAYAALSRASVEAIEVDGEPLATPAPAPRKRVYRVAPSQGDLFGAPRTIDRRATAGVLLSALADLEAAGDERSRLRTDTSRLAIIGTALTHAVTLTESEGAVLIGGADTEANRRRWNAAIWAAATLRVEVRRGIWYRLVNAGADDPYTIGPANWWLKSLGVGEGGYRLAGALFRPQTKRGILERTIAGIEGGLAWGPSGGRGKGGARPTNLVAERAGGAGPEVEIPWWLVLRLAGEPVGPEHSSATSTPEGARYHARVAMLRKRGRSYFAPNQGRGEAEAGDTIEVVREIKGARGPAKEGKQVAGLVVRASARYIEAYSKGGERARIPAARLLLPY